MTHWSIQVFGRVQGVGFRYFTYRKARQQNLKGWVRNESDGSVRIAVSADHNQLETFLAEIRKGPSFSKITDIQCEESPAEPHIEFTIKR